MTDETNRPRVSVMLGADSLAGRRSGIGRMTFEIASRLAGHPGLGDFGFLADGHVHRPEWLHGPVDAAFSPPRSRVAEALARLWGLSLVRNAWRRESIARQAASIRSAGRPVVYHETNFIPVPYPGPTTVTVHDLFWHTDPAFVPAERRRWIDRNLPRTLKEVSRFVCVSQFTARELGRHFGVVADRIRVVPEAASSLFQPMTAAAAKPILDRFGLADRSYILAASTLEPRKNLDRLFAAHQNLPDRLRQGVPLVIAGGQGWGRVLPAAERARASGALRLIGHVADRDLAALMARAAAFAIVSLKEGFGLPVLEAMASDTAVIAAGTTATAETAGQGALLVDPENVEAITTALRHMVEDREAAGQWRARGLLRAQEFSWQTTVDHLVEVWRDVVS